MAKLPCLRSRKRLAESVREAASGLATPLIPISNP